ncbi:MAG: hypothetical protein HQK74_11810 [Desulfamplus sp.]|nr:hypothetical protein [Desulfamplus sp.]
MKSSTLPDFWEGFNKLPASIQDSAVRAYRLWKINHFAGSLRFKCVSENESVWSVRIGHGYRALGLLEADTVYWYFIGNHDQYERQLKSLY